LEAAKADRAARLAVIQELGGRLAAIEADAAARFRQHSEHLRALQAELAARRFRRARVAVRNLLRRIDALFRR
jgi:hypothetical protein